MDISENRKRPRTEDSIMGPDISEHNPSASMIANTSLQETGTARRRRISSSDAGPSGLPNITSTPEPNTQARILDQMNTIRDDIILEETSPQVSSNINLNQQDLSSTAEQFNLNNMVSGVRQLTRDIANIHEPSPGSLAWDDGDMNIPSLPMISPRPVPDIVHIDHGDSNINPLLLPEPVPVIVDVHTDTPARQTPPPNSPLPLTQTTPDIVDSLKDMVQKQFRTAFDNIETKLIERIREHARTSDQQFSENKEAIAIVSARTDNNEQDIERHQFEIENISEDISTHIGHINRIDEALNVITHARDQPIQDLLSRIAALEANQAQNQISNDDRELFDRLKKKAQKEDDSYYMSTVVFRGFNPQVVSQNTHGIRSSARAVLAIIGSEDVIGFTSRIAFSNDNTKMRLTFNYTNDYLTAVHHLSKSIKQIKNAGQTPGILFSTLTPPRFNRERGILQKIADEMKRDGQIIRYSFVLSRNELCLKVSKQGQRDTIIHVPAETEDMDVSPPEQDQAGSRCPICLSPFDATTQINVYSCGHTFHAPCLRSSLAQSMKCPTCRTIPTQIQLEQLECTRCRSDILDPQSVCTLDQIVLSRRCNHLHLYECQMSYLNTLEGSYPTTPEGFNDIVAAEGIQGCASCYLGDATNFQHNSIIHDVAFQAGMSDYIELEPDVNNDQPSDPAPQPPLSGANAIPIRAGPRPINRPDNPPPPPPSSPGRRNRQRTRRN